MLSVDQAFCKGLLLLYSLSAVAVILVNCKLSLLNIFFQSNYRLTCIDESTKNMLMDKNNCDKQVHVINQLLYLQLK